MDYRGVLDRHTRVRHRAGGQQEWKREGGKIDGMNPEEQYFKSYANLGIHEEMIRDRVRTDAYRDAIEMNSSYIKGKVVLDVGCGTSILSIFAARAGARKVYAVDASDIALKAKEVVQANGLADVITVLHGKVEDVEIDEKVDVLISEWMGYMLLYESMLGSVLYARDKWLKPDGLMLPGQATLYIAAITFPERYTEGIDFWRDVYGIDMSVLIPAAKKAYLGEPAVESVTAENVLTWPAVLKTIDCKTVSADELTEVTAKFSASSMMMASLHGFVLWFDVAFQRRTPLAEPSPDEDKTPTPPEPNGSSSSLQPKTLNGRSVAAIKRKRSKDGDDLVLSTAPEEEPTHWAQTVLYIDEPVLVDQDQRFEGSLTITQSKESARFLDLELHYSVGEHKETKTFTFR